MKVFKHFFSKTALALLLFGSSMTMMHAQKYYLTFEGMRDATTVETVTVENLTRGTSLTMPGDGTLVLKLGDVSIIERERYAKQKLLIYPNPSNGPALMQFSFPTDGNVSISLYDMAGKLHSQTALQLSRGTHLFNLPAMATGVYMVSVRSNDYSFIGKWVSMGNNASSSSRIELLSSMDLPVGETTKPVTKATNEEYEMNYTKDDLLRLTGKTGDYTTIVMKSPKASQEVIFEFLACTDGDGNHYPIVQIGKFLWMAEDLRAVRTVNGASFNLISDHNTWTNANHIGTPMIAYSNFNSTVNNFGVFYNYKAASEAAPSGFRLPKASEYYSMTKIYGDLSIMGDALKSTDNGSLWVSTETATNESGFNAYGTGYLHKEDGFKSNEVCYWAGDVLKNDLAAYAKLTGSSKEFYNSTPGTIQGIDIGCGLKVRYIADATFEGEREMITELFGNIPDGSANDIKPLGERFNLTDGRKTLFLGYGYYDNGNGGHFLRMAETIAPDGTGTPASNLPGFHASLDSNTWMRDRPKKAIGQRNADGTQNLVFAVVNENNSMSDWFAGASSYNPRVNYPETINITLHVFGDSASGYAQKTSVTLEGDFNMMQTQLLNHPNNSSHKYSAISELQSGTNFLRFAWTWTLTMGFPPVEIQYVNTPVTHMESRGAFVDFFYMLFDVKAADLNGDGVDEIIIAIYDKMCIYDGVTYEQLSYRDFRNDHFSNTVADTNAFYIRFDVGDINNDGKKDLLVCTSAPTAGSATLHTFLGCEDVANQNFLNVPQGSNYFTKNINPSGTGIHAANILIGEFDGENGDEIAIHGRKGKDFVIACYKYNARTNAIDLKAHRTNPAPTRTFKYSRWEDTSSPMKSKEITSCVPYINPMATLRWKGASFPADIVAQDGIYSYNVSSGTIDRIDGSSFDIKNKNGRYFNREIVTGNFIGDGADCEQVLVSTGESIHFFNKPITGNVIHNTLKVMRSNANTIPFGDIATYSNLTIAALSSPGSNRVLEYVGYEYMLSKPTVNALLAAAPYYEGATSPGGTYWGTSTSSSTSVETEHTVETSVMVGYENEFSEPFLGTSLGGIDISSKVTMGITAGFSMEKNITKSISYETGEEDAVVLTATPYDMYIYRIVKSPNSKEVGSLITMAFPKKTVSQIVSLEDYTYMTRNDRSAPRLDNIFSHTVGYPFSYPSSESNLSNIYGPRNYFHSGEGGFTGVGTTGTTHKSITIDNSISGSLGLSVGMEVELVTKFPGGAKVGAGIGYNNTNTITKTIGEGTEVGGSINGLPSSLGSEYKRFSWNLIFYNYKQGGQEFPVINYIVQPQ